MFLSTKSQYPNLYHHSITCPPSALFGGCPAGCYMKCIFVVLSLFVFLTGCGDRTASEDVVSKREWSNSVEYHRYDEISRALGGFSTYTTEPLPILLSKYGISIGSVREITISKSVVKYRITLLGPALSSTPCFLSDWIVAKGRFEFAERNGNEFPDLSSKIDPVLYWAATGKCLAAYKL